jgi:hypothetical protein
MLLIDNPCSVPGLLGQGSIQRKLRRVENGVKGSVQQKSKLGTHYFFLSPLPLVRYLEIVLPLRAGPLFSKIC